MKKIPVLDDVNNPTYEEFMSALTEEDEEDEEDEEIRQGD